LNIILVGNLFLVISFFGLNIAIYMNKISVPLGQKNIVIFSKTAFEEL
jgi:hypothetical protein